MPLHFVATSVAPLHAVASGAGPAVVCLHSSGSSSSQWRRLMESDAPGHRFVAFDFHGHGRSPEQPPDYGLAVESRAVWNAIASVREPIHLVGHSYGGAVAVDLALRHAERIASLTLYEPVLFSALTPEEAAYREITSVGLGIVRDARAGDLEAATSAFIDYWNGAGAWRAMPAGQQERARARIVPVARHFEALFAGGLTLERLRALHVPTLLLGGDRSPAAARAVCARLATLACVKARTFRGLGHMGPITHPEVVNTAIAAHLDAQSSLADAA